MIEKVTTLQQAMEQEVINVNRMSFIREAFYKIVAGWC